MKIIEQKYKSNNIQNVYVVFRSKDGMKRSHWRHMVTLRSLDDVAEYLSYRKTGDFLSYKYRIVFREITTKDVSVSPQEIMVMRIKHGI
jgi:hypothetical protein